MLVTDNHVAISIYEARVNEDGADDDEYNGAPDQALIPFSLARISLLQLLVGLLHVFCCFGKILVIFLQILALWIEQIRRILFIAIASPG